MAIVPAACSASPEAGVCGFTPTIACSDGLVDQGESDVDCGGTQCPQTCASGQQCVSDNDCQPGLTCVASFPATGAATRSARRDRKGSRRGADDWSACGISSCPVPLGVRVVGPLPPLLETSRSVASSGASGDVLNRRTIACRATFPGRDHGRGGSIGRARPDARGATNSALFRRTSRARAGLLSRSKVGRARLRGGDDCLAAVAGVRASREIMLSSSNASGRGEHPDRHEPPGGHAAMPAQPRRRGDPRRPETGSVPELAAL